MPIATTDDIGSSPPHRGAGNLANFWQPSVRMTSHARRTHPQPAPHGLSVVTVDVVRVNAAALEAELPDRPDDHVSWNSWWVAVGPEGFHNTWPTNEHRQSTVATPRVRPLAEDKDAPYEVEDLGRGLTVVGPGGYGPSMSESPMRTPCSVPGLRYLADWLGPDACGALLSDIDTAPWSTQLKRRVQHYGRRYDYGRRSVPADEQVAAPALPAWATHLGARLVTDGLLDRAAEQVIVNEYQPGQGISAHVDCVPCFGPVIAAISLGSGCQMDFTNPEDGTKLAVPLAAGSLLIMAGSARYTWRHGIAARKSDPGAHGRVPRARRVSVTFRTLPRPGR